MKASELRIGNYIQNFHSNCDITQVDVECFTGNGYYDGEMDGEGIPLTDEWLVKFGFEILGVLVKQNDHMRLLCEYGVYFFQTAIVKTEIKYVHQLQNLYFAVTGDELTIKN